VNSSNLKNKPRENLKALKLLEGVRKKKFGPYPSFLPIDVLRAVWKLEQRKGRARLSGELGIGEWSTRTILKFLKKEGIVDVTPMGYKLTENGFKTLNEIKKYAVDASYFPQTSLTLNKKSFGILIRGKKPIRVLDVRDEAVRMGADGITLLSFKKGKFHFVDSGDEVQSEYNNAVSKIFEKFRVADGDMVLLCFGEKELERAAWSCFVKIIR
jgi:predicted transcriptional regulator